MSDGSIHPYNGILIQHQTVLVTIFYYPHEWEIIAAQEIIDRFHDVSEIEDLENIHESEEEKDAREEIRGSNGKMVTNKYGKCIC